MSLSQNLAIANYAIAEISKLGIVSCNKIDHRIRASGGIEKVIGTNQGMHESNWCAAEIGVSSVQSQITKDVRKYADLIKKNKFGNCGELARVAAIYMIDSGGKPVHLMYFTNRKAGYDHMWATIGVRDGWQPQNLRSWGDEAVWVDPWQTDNGIAFSIIEFIAGTVRNLNAIYKCNTIESVEAGGIQGCRLV